MKRKKLLNKFVYGFTLTEIIVTLMTIGVISVFTVAKHSDSIISKGDKLHNKTSYLVEEIVAELHSNQVAYPDTLNIETNGFRNTSNARIDGIDYSGNDKFCRLFASFFEKVDKNLVKCHNLDENTDIRTLDPSFVTEDGIGWWLPSTDFSLGYAIIFTDVDLNERSSNCELDIKDRKYPNNKFCAPPKSTSVADTFRYYVSPDGVINLKDPSGDINTKYRINLRIISKDEDGNVVPNAKFGRATITEGTTGNPNSNLSFDNLKKDTVYTLLAIPNTGYFSNWSGDKRKINIQKKINNVVLEFYKKKLSCIRLKASSADALSHVNGTLGYNCKYSVSSSGDYIRGNGAAEFIYCPRSNCSENPADRYRFDCTNSKNLTKSSSKNDEFEVCGLEAGDYKLDLIAKDNFTFNNNKNEFIQNVHLGTEDLKFDINIGIASRCQSRTFSNNGRCQSCMEHCLVCTDASTCLSCETGYYVGNSKKCLKCQPDACAACNDEGICTYCKSNFHIEGVGRCCNNNSGECKGCSVGCIKCNNSTCEKCDEEYKLVNGTCIEQNSNCTYDTGCYRCLKIGSVGCISVKKFEGDWQWEASCEDQSVCKNLANSSWAAVVNNKGVVTTYNGWNISWTGSSGSLPGGGNGWTQAFGNVSRSYSLPAWWGGGAGVFSNVSVGSAPSEAAVCYSGSPYSSCSSDMRGCRVTGANPFKYSGYSYCGSVPGLIFFTP